MDVLPCKWTQIADWTHTYRDRSDVLEIAGTRIHRLHPQWVEIFDLLERAPVDGARLL